MRWYFTPGWIWRLPLMIGLLAGAALVEGTASIVMGIGGLLLLIHGWASTIINVRRVNREVVETEKEQLRELDREAEDYFRRIEHAKR